MPAAMEKELITVLKLNRQLHRAIADALDKKIGFIVPQVNRVLIDLHNQSNLFDRQMLFVSCDRVWPEPRSRKEAAKIRRRKLVSNKLKKEYVVEFEHDLAPTLAIEALKRSGTPPETIKRLVPEAAV